MPPKSAKGKKGKKAKQPKDQPDYVGQIAQLTEEISGLKRDLRGSQEERNYFQLERDKTAQLFETTFSQNESLKLQLASQGRQLQEISESHAVSVRVYQQKLKDLLYQNSQNQTNIKHSAESELRGQEDYYRSRESELLSEIDALKAKIKQQEDAGNDQLRAQKDQAARQLSLLREEYEAKTWASLRDFESKLHAALQEAELRRKAELSEVETQKNQQIQALIQQHERNFAKMKEYYQQITSSNLELIKNLKDELEEMRKKQVANEQLMYEIAQENRRLTTPLQGALSENEQLKKELDLYKKANEDLQKDSSKAAKMEFLNSQMQWENDQLKIALKDTARERDELRSRFETAVADQQQKGAFKINVLERRIIALQQELENKAATLAEVMAAANLDGAVASNVSQQMDNVLEGKNRNIRELSFELARVMRLYNEALRVYRSKMTAAGLETGDIDAFRPFEVRDDL